jgi:RpiR family carbohydrate utilization transcriptional regulator
LPMTSRLVQLVILDVLAAGVTLRRGEGFTPHLARIKDSLKDTRFPTS